MAIDPICGMTVEPETAAGRFDYKGKTYYFCATSCLDRFRADPEKALSKKPRHLVTGPVSPTTRKPLPMMMPAAPAVGSARDPVCGIGIGHAFDIDKMIDAVCNRLAAVAAIITAAGISKHFEAAAVVMLEDARHQVLSITRSILLEKIRSAMPESDLTALVARVAGCHRAEFHALQFRVRAVNVQANAGADHDARDGVRDGRGEPNRENDAHGGTTAEN